MELVLLGIGLVLVFEGLVLALLPSRLEELIKMISELSVESRRAYGLAAVALGVVLVWIALALS